LAPSIAFLEDSLPCLLLRNNSNTLHNTIEPEDQAEEVADCRSLSECKPPQIATVSVVAEAFLWTASSDVGGLSGWPGGTGNSRATGVSGEGVMTVGRGTSVSGSEACLWDSGHGMRRDWPARRLSLRKTWVSRRAITASVPRAETIVSICRLGI
jgi:hypothetical protein